MTDPKLPTLIDLIAMAVAPASRLDGDLTERITDDIVGYRSFKSGPDAYLHAIDEAIQRSELDTPYRTQDHAAFADFLVRLASALRARQPWPRPVLRRLPTVELGQFSHHVGTLNLTRIAAHHKLGERFDRVRDAEGEQHVMLLRLSTGEEVGLFAPTQRTARGVDIRQREPGDASQTLQHFEELTGLQAESLSSAG